RFVRGWLGDHKAAITMLERGTIGLAVYVSFSGAVEQDIWTRIDVAAWVVLLLATGLLLLLGYGGVWLLAGSLRLPRDDRISMVFAGAQKSVAMGAPMAAVLFPAKISGLILLPLLIYHLAQMVVAAPLAARLRATAA
ncbi:MAG: bile acid:sodium symporter, partial [Novosphingobium sp.]